ncbi:hypothetical protein BH11PLA2_BH11PLA2_00270 [soil metagenome]
MKIRYTVLSLLILNSLLIAADPKPNTLTPKEIADGWILLFDGETTFGWEILGKGEVKTENGKLVLGGNAKGQAQMAMLPKGKFLANGAEFDHPKANFIHFATRNDSPDTWSDIKYKPADLKPLFNGKDLTGWKLFEGDAKRKASKFEVTKDGELKVSNGPGDLQTESTYADFLLQFDCKTNGTALNSGIFFRCLPNQYQQGYEAQIQNAIVNNDRSKPLDYGTGAIYRRIAARKVVSNDNEWFTMTVVAVGPLLRTWVNGYPVVSWKDDRKPADNARNGQYLKAGHLSIQGHDPTTDILFRNIKIVEIKK